MPERDPHSHAASGVVRPVALYGHPVLSRACRPVTVFDDELGRLVVDMFATMYAAEGVGLAANQIGVDARVFVVDCPDASGRHTVAHVVNPVLEEPTDRELVTEPEGCLSVPGAYGDLARLATVAVQGVDRHGDPVRLVGTGLLARCFQHEVAPRRDRLRRPAVATRAVAAARGGPAAGLSDARAAVSGRPGAMR